MCVCAMRSLKIEKAKQILEIIKNENWEEIGFMSLRSYIIKNIGGDERTVSSYIKLMLEAGLIEDIGNQHFRIL